MGGEILGEESLAKAGGGTHANAVNAVSLLSNYAHAVKLPFQAMHPLSRAEQFDRLGRFRAKRAQPGVDLLRWPCVPKSPQAGMMLYLGVKGMGRAP